jgi:hypothetical protein
MSLDAPDLADFEGAAIEVAESIRLTPANTATLVDAALAQLGNGSFDAEELHRRTRRFIEVLPSNPAVERALAVGARGSKPEIKSAIVAQVSGELRQLVYADVIAEVDTGPPTVPLETLKVDEAIEALLDPQPADDWQTVLLLGDRQDVEGNTRFLESRGLVPITVSTVERLEALGGERICGVVIHRSWRTIIPSGHLLSTFLRAELERANVVYYRIDVGDLGVDDSTELQGLLDEYDSHVRANVKMTDGCTLADFDALELRRNAGLLSSSERTGVTIDGLATRERRILTAAVAMFQDQTRGIKTDRALEVSASPLTSGRSGARVLRVTVEGGRSVVVAKFDEVTKLQAEMRRARSITPADQLLPMAVYSLGGVAVMIQQLVSDADQASAAAPSLRERLEALSAWEGGRPSPAPPAREDLVIGLRRAFDVIKQLNAHPLADSKKECWTGTEPIASMSGLGIEWVLEADDGEFNARDPLELVSATVAELDREITVHGDLHAGNILLPDDRMPRLIDFAQAGAGHPAFDLVRLSSAIAYASLRCLVSERRMRSYFAAVHLTATPADALENEFADVLAAASARIANNALVLARDAALAVLPDDQSGRAQYRAMVYLIGLQSLTRPEFQAGIVRSALGAIKPHLTGT